MYVSLKTKKYHLLSIWQNLFDQKLRVELYTIAHSTPCMVKDVFTKESKPS